MSAQVLEEELEFDMTHVESLRDDKLLPKLARLRDCDPVHWSKTNRCWQITAYEDVAAAFQDARFSNVRMSTYAFRSIPEAEHERRIPNLTRYIQGWIVNNDGDVHRRLRGVTTKALNKKFVDSLRPLFQSLSSELTERVIELRQCDFAAQIAYFLPATVILTLLGLPLSHLEKVRDWNRAITRALAAVFAPSESLIAADQAIDEMNKMMLVEIAKRRDLPGDDLLTQLITLSDDATGTLSSWSVPHPAYCGTRDHRQFDGFWSERVGKQSRAGPTLFERQGRPALRHARAIAPHRHVDRAAAGRRRGL